MSIRKALLGGMSRAFWPTLLALWGLVGLKSFPLRQFPQSPALKPEGGVFVATMKLPVGIHIPRYINDRQVKAQRSSRAFYTASPLLARNNFLDPPRQLLGVFDATGLPLAKTPAFKDAP
jgi:hypothetical protein